MLLPRLARTLTQRVPGRRNHSCVHRALAVVPSAFGARALSAPAHVAHPAPLTLNTLAPNSGAVKQKRRVGRGIGSGRGKTCKKGHKGTKARSGSVPLGFEGGQTPLHRRIPKRGFKNGPDTSFETVSVEKLWMHVAMGHLSPREGALITMKDLQDAGVVDKIKHGVRLVAAGPRRALKGGGGAETEAVAAAAAGDTEAAEAEAGANAEGWEARALAVPRLPPESLPPLHLEVSRASAAAIEAVEVAGGSVTCAHFNRLALRALLKPDKFVELPRRARPPPRLMPFFLDFGRRGYLSPEVQARNLRLFGQPTSETRPSPPEAAAAVAAAAAAEAETAALPQRPAPVG